MLIKILLKSKEISLRTLIQDFELFRKVFSIQCEALDEFIDRAYISTFGNNGTLSNVEWDNNEDELVFFADTACYSSKKIRE